MGGRPTTLKTLKGTKKLILTIELITIMDPNSKEKYKQLLVDDWSNVQMDFYIKDDNSGPSVVA